MRVLTILAVLLLVSPVYAELTKEDIRAIIKEENGVLEKRLKEYIDLKIETVNARIDGVEKNLSDRIGDLRVIMIALIGLMTAAIAIPRFIIAYKKVLESSQRAMESSQKAMQTQIEQLREQIEALQNTPS